MTKDMNGNVNTKEYWEQRFSSGDWEEKRGRWQTGSFARGQLPYLRIGEDFEGTILDFGCGLGDAMEIYRENIPKAKLIGIDISPSAIELCQMKYGSIATFMQGDYKVVPYVDVIIASNVFEHLSDDREVARSLLSKCKDLYVVVPYKEWPLYPEHINTYDENCYSDIGEYDWKVFPCKGWSLYGWRLWYHIYFKNIFRLILRRRLKHRGLQIVFHFKGFHK
ncbi:MAG: class I SAM-dependent methyltransferase [Deltaproteobacteria bacterium]|nr:class I SAM-dependent methyltransferase [Deltaproteobacteria bacterium]